MIPARLPLRQFLLLPCGWIAVASASLPIGPDLIVAADGSGDFRSIHDAVQSIPADNRERTIVLIKAGVYREPVRVDAAFVTLRGASRTGTRLEFSPAGTERATDRGEAVLNLGATAHDFVLENVTVTNTHSHTGAISGLADRTVLLNCTFNGPPGGFLAGRHHGTSSYLIDCTFSPAIRDLPTARVTYSRGDGELPREQITAARIFAQRWDPERTDAPRIINLRHQAQPDRLIVTFSEAVTVRGRPQLAFANGETTELLSGSGTPTLEFSSTHAAFGGTVPKLELNGGAIFSTEAGVQVRRAALTFP